MALLNTTIGPERVQTFDQPLGSVQPQGIPLSSAAFLIGTTLSGAPENTATKVRNLAEFVDAFGGPDDVLYDGYYAVKGYFDNAGTGNTAIIVNCGSAPSAADFVGDSADKTGMRALDSEDVLGLICVPGLPLSMAYLVDAATVDYSETIRAEFGATLSTSFSILAIPKEISKADTDQLVVTGQFVSISGSGPYVLKLQNLSSAVAEISTFTILAATGAGITPGSFVSLYTSAGVQTKYWFSVDGGGVAPSGTVVEVALVSGDTTNQIAVKLAAAINPHADFVAPAPGAAVVTVTNAYVGPMTDASASQALEVTAGTSTQGAYGSLALANVTPGMLLMNTAGSFKGVVSAVNDSTDEVTILTNPSPAFSAGNDVHIKLPSAINYKDLVVNNPSRVSAWYFNNPIVLDEAAAADPGDVLSVSPVGHVCGIIARIDANTQAGGPSHAPAGIQLAGLVGIQGLSLAISERDDAAPLRLAFINRITSFPGSGNIIFGGYTAGGAAVTADERLIQVMRTLQYIKISLDNGLIGFLWENFDPVTQGRVAGAILSFLRNNDHLFPKGLPELQKFRVISVEPTQDEEDAGLLRARVQVKPNKAVRFIEIALEYPIPQA